jgi:hypothetical protein
MQEYKFRTKNIIINRLNENGYKNMLYIEIIPYNSKLNINKVKNI